MFGKKDEKSTALDIVSADVVAAHQDARESFNGSTAEAITDAINRKIQACLSGVKTPVFANGNMSYRTIYLTVTDASDAVIDVVARQYLCKGYEFIYYCVGARQFNVLVSWDNKVRGTERVTEAQKDSLDVKPSEGRNSSLEVSEPSSHPQRSSQKPDGMPDAEWQEEVLHSKLFYMDSDIYVYSTGLVTVNPALCMKCAGINLSLGKTKGWNADAISRYVAAYCALCYGTLAVQGNTEKVKRVVHIPTAHFDSSAFKVASERLRSMQDITIDRLYHDIVSVQGYIDPELICRDFLPDCSYDKICDIVRERLAEGEVVTEPSGT